MLIFRKNASEFYDLPDLRLERLLDLYAQEIQWVSDGFIHCGDMSFIHGHEMRGIGGVNLPVNCTLNEEECHLRTPSSS